MRKVIDVKDARIVIECHNNGEDIRISHFVGGPHFNQLQSTVAVAGESWNIATVISITYQELNQLISALEDMH